VSCALRYACERLARLWVCREDSAVLKIAWPVESVRCATSGAGASDTKYVRIERGDSVVEGCCGSDMVYEAEVVGFRRKEEMGRATMASFMAV